MNPILIALAISLAANGLLAVSGCTAVPYQTATRACDLLQIATDEAEMAPAWYVGAGEVLEQCGKPNARLRAEVQACFAEKRNGYRDASECEAME